MKIRFFPVLIAIVLLLCSTNAFSVLAIDIEPDYSTYCPDLYITGSVPKMEPGSSQEIMIGLNNASRYGGENIVVAYEPVNGEKFYKPTSLSSRINVGSLSGFGKTNIRVPVTILEDAEPGFYSITLTINYTNFYKYAFKVTETLKIEVVSLGASTGSPKVELKDFALVSSKPVDNKVALSVNVINNGEGSASDVSVELGGTSNDTISVYNIFGPRVLGDIASNDVKTANFTLYVSPALKTGNYPLKVIVKYFDASGNEKSKEYNIFLFIEMPDDAGTASESTPRVIVKNYSLGGDNIKVGDNFAFDFTLENTSKNSPVSNMKITVSSADGVFLPAAGTNSFFVDKILSGESKNLSLLLTTKRDAETKPYTLDINIDYENSAGKEFSAKESISIPVTQSQRLEVGQVNYFTGGVGMPAPLSFQYFNKGKGMLYNLSIKIEGPFTSQNGESYIGNFSSSSSDYFEDMISPNEAGDLKGEIVFAYEDANGEKQEYRQPFFAVVQDMPVVNPDMPDNGKFPIEEQKAGVGVWTYVIGGAVLVVLTIVLTIIIRRRRKKAKEMVDDE